LLGVLRLGCARAMQTDGDEGEEEEQVVGAHGRGLGTGSRVDFILDQAVSHMGRGRRTVALKRDNPPFAKKPQRMGHPVWWRAWVFILGRVCLRSVRWKSSWI
jgi:hypothetical protein